MSSERGTSEWGETVSGQFAGSECGIMSAGGFMHALVVDDLIGARFKSDLSIAKIVEHGLPTDSLNLLKDHGLTFTEVGEVVIAPRTLKHRKARGENLSGEESDRALRVARVMALGNEVFG